MDFMKKVIHTSDSIKCIKHDSLDQLTITTKAQVIDD